MRFFKHSEDNGTITQEVLEIGTDQPELPVFEQLRAVETRNGAIRFQTPTWPGITFVYPSDVQNHSGLINTEEPQAPTGRKGGVWGQRLLGFRSSRL